MGSIISADNKSLLTPNNSSFRCNCRNKNNCPLEGNCLTQKVIYQADVSGGGGGGVGGVGLAADRRISKFACRRTKTFKK